MTPKDILRRVRKAEARALDEARRAVQGEVEDVGTGFTILHRQDSPIARLINKRRIGAEELRAAEDISTALQAIGGALLMRSCSMERVDRSATPREPPAVIDAVARYRAWADVWSSRTLRGDPTLQIVIAVIAREQSFRAIEIAYGLRNGTASRACAAALRDYAARAGWATGAASRTWRVEEGAIFRLKRMRPVETLASMARRWDRARAA